MAHADHNGEQPISVIDLAKQLWDDLPRYQLRDNARWLQMIHGMLRPGGIWGWPSSGRVFKKVEEGFVEIKSDG